MFVTCDDIIIIIIGNECFPLSSNPSWSPSATWTFFLSYYTVLSWCDIFALCESWVLILLTGKGSSFHSFLFFSNVIAVIVDVLTVRLLNLIPLEDPKLQKAEKRNRPVPSMVKFWHCWTCWRNNHLHGCLTIDADGSWKSFLCVDCKLSVTSYFQVNVFIMPVDRGINDVPLQQWIY